MKNCVGKQFTDYIELILILFCIGFIGLIFTCGSESSNIEDACMLLALIFLIFPLILCGCGINDIMNDSSDAVGWLNLIFGLIKIQKPLKA